MLRMHCRAMDKGCFSSAEILTAHQAGITATVPRPETPGNRSKGRFVKADSPMIRSVTSTSALRAKT